MVFEPGHPVRALTIACPADVHGAPPSRPIMHALSTCAVPDPSLDWAARLSMYESQLIVFGRVVRLPSNKESEYC